MDQMNRDIRNKLNYILDNLLPPAIRDSKAFMWLPLRIYYGKKYKYVMEFREKFPYMSEEEINEYYRILADPKRTDTYTDLNKKCVERIINEVKGNRILEAAAGTGYLAKKLHCVFPDADIVACDIVPPVISDVISVSASITALPFDDDSFDTVICTHALEHIKDAEAALAELRRVCKKELIIVLPRQREYLYHFNLHVKFFPYEFSVRSFLGNKASIDLLSGDWFCVEEMAGA